MKNRISALSRWPVDRQQRRERAKTDIVFFQVMRDLLGERFITKATFRQYRVANEMLLSTEGGDDDLED
jgi:hypothetical protein